MNDDITDDGKIDYKLTNKVPVSLRKAIAEGKKILVLINPPYAEVGTGHETENKVGVAKTKIAITAMVNYGKASNEIFAQFVVRISQEIPTATLARLSTLKYINSPNFEIFRDTWNAKYLGGFVVHSKAFDGLSGNFPIGFLVWKTDWNVNIKQPITEITTEFLDKNALAIGKKYSTTYEAILI